MTSRLGQNSVVINGSSSGTSTITAPADAGSTTLTLPSSSGTLALTYTQTWQDVTGSRVSGTTYTNSTGNPIQISIVVNSTGSNQGTLVINGVTAVSAIVGAVNATHQYAFIIPNNNTYVLTLTGGSVNRWLELR